MVNGISLSYPCTGYLLATDSGKSRLARKQRWTWEPSHFPVIMPFHAGVTLNAFPDFSCRFLKNERGLRALLSKIQGEIGGGCLLSW